MIYLALSYDHRIVDGADAARFLTTMKNRLEEGGVRGLARPLTAPGTSPEMMPERIAVTGSSGLIGTALVRHLRARGDDVLRLVEAPARAAGRAAVGPVLAPPRPRDARRGGRRGQPGGRRRRRPPVDPGLPREILASRTDSTQAVADRGGRRRHAVRLVSGSAVGFYGDRGDEELTEDSTAGEGFLPEVVLAWEASAPSRRGGRAPAWPSSGPASSSAPGAARSPRSCAWPGSGLGGPLGSGRQFWPWITLEDAVRGLVHLVDSPDVTGPVNLVGPEPSRQRDLARALGAALHRPAVLPAPAFALHAVVGEFAGDILSSQRVVGRRLRESGFAYTHRDLDAAVAWVLDRPA